MNQNLPLGVIYTIVSTLFYSSQLALVKAYASEVPLSVIIFYQCATGLVLFIPILLKNGLTSAKKLLITQQLPIHLLRTVCSLCVAFLLFTAVKYIPLVNAMLLANIAPLVVPFVAYFLLAQKINHKVWLPMLVGFMGVTLVLNPDGRIFHPAALLAIGASISVAGSMVLVRKLSAKDSSETISFYFFLLGTIFSGCIAVRYWVPLSLPLELILIGIGALYVVSQLLVTNALRLANPQLVSSLAYTNVVFTAFISMIFWHKIPGALTWSGILLTIIGGIMCIRVEYRHNRRSVEVMSKQLDAA